MNFCTAKETAEKWGISKLFVRKLCKEGRIGNAIWDENTWLIPSRIEKPERKKTREKNGAPLEPDFSEYVKRIVRRELRTITILWLIWKVNLPSPHKMIFLGLMILS